MEYTGIRWAVAVCLSYFNYRMLKIVGMSAIACTIFTLIPFVFFCAIGPFHKDFTTKGWSKVRQGCATECNWPIFGNRYSYSFNHTGLLCNRVRLANLHEQYKFNQTR